LSKPFRCNSTKPNQAKKQKKIFPGPPGFRQHRNQIRTLVIAADVSSAFSPLFEDFATVSDLEKSASKKPTLNQTTGRQIREPAKTRSWMKKVQRKIPKKPKNIRSRPRTSGASQRRRAGSEIQDLMRDFKMDLYHNRLGLTFELKSYQK